MATKETISSSRSLFLTESSSELVLIETTQQTLCQRSWTLILKSISAKSWSDQAKRRCNKSTRAWNSRTTIDHYSLDRWTPLESSCQVAKSGKAQCNHLLLRTQTPQHHRFLLWRESHSKRCSTCATRRANGRLKTNSKVSSLAPPSNNLTNSMSTISDQIK